MWSLSHNLQLTFSCAVRGGRGGRFRAFASASASDAAAGAGMYTYIRPRSGFVPTCSTRIEEDHEKLVAIARSSLCLVAWWRRR